MIGVSVMFTKTLEDSFSRILLIKKHFENKNNELLKRCGYKPKKIKGKMLYTLQGLPNVGKIRAKRLLEYFGNIKNIVNASESELKNVEGINKKIALKIINMINNNFDK